MKEDRGPRFAAEVGDPRATEWRPATELFGSGLDSALAAVTERRGAPHRAVAGAALFERYAMRLVQPFLAAVVLERRMVDPHIDRVWVRETDDGLDRVAFLGPATSIEDDGSAGLGVLMADNLAIAVEQVHRRARTPTRVLHGSVAHAVTVTAVHLSWPDEHPARYLDAAERVLDLWGLNDLVVLGPVAVAGEDWLYAERRTCCLAFRSEQHRRRPDPFCATCPATPEWRRRKSFFEAVAAFRERTGRAAFREVQ